MNEPMGSAPLPESGNRNRNMIIGIVVGLIVLCCCCLLIALPALWFCGDMLTGLATTCTFP